MRNVAQINVLNLQCYIKMLDMLLSPSRWKTTLLINKIVQLNLLCLSNTMSVSSPEIRYIVCLFVCVALRPGQHIFSHLGLMSTKQWG